MSNLLEILDQTARSLAGVEPTDLQRLTEVHTQLEALLEQAGRQLESALASSVVTRATDVARTIEKVILEEVDRGEEALVQAARTLEDLRALVENRSVEPPPPATQPGELPPRSEAAPEPVSSSRQEASPPPQAEPAAVAPASVPSPSSAEAGPVIPEEVAFSGEDLQLVQEFIVEARGHLESAEAAILKLEESPEDGESINAIFRSFHTVKGVAGFLNLRQIGALAHASENLLDLARHGKLAVTPAAIDLVLESLDTLKQLVDELEQTAPRGLPMSRREGLGGLIRRLECFAEGRSPTAETGRESPAGATTSTAGESVATTRDTTGTHPGKESSGGHSRSSASDGTIKVSTERLDNLINMVGELVIAQSMVNQDVSSLVGIDQRLERNLSHLGKITRSLQELSMAMRMVPVSGLFQKMGRLVRDLGRKSNKSIELVITGAETELDRSVVEELGDPLVHMIRNAVDHGIESPEKRLAAGKPAVGKVHLRAYHKGGNVVIEIEDDGRGLDRSRLRQKGIERGVFRPDDQPTDQELFNLIFLPGLSTAEKVTEVSGRGVGMDVVKRNIDALRGSIEIDSVEGRGTRFTIRLPLTLAVIDGLIVRVGSERYILPITAIEQSIRPAEGQVSTVQGRGEMCLVRGSLLPVVRLHRQFGIEGAREEPTEALIVVVQDNQRRFCLLVDELVGQQQVVIKSLGEAIGQVPGVSGAAILGDGSITLILDIANLGPSRR